MREERDEKETLKGKYEEDFAGCTTCIDRGGSSFHIGCTDRVQRYADWRG